MKTMISLTLISIIAYFSFISCTSINQVKPNNRIDATELIISVNLREKTFIKFDQKGARLLPKNDFMELRKKYDTTKIADNITTLVRIHDIENEKYSVKELLIVGKDVSGKNHVIELIEADHLIVKQFNLNKTILTTYGVILGSAAIVVVAILASSCPLIDSYDGENYHFDAEPLGGAICKGMQRTDLVNLEYLKLYENEYKIRMHNQKNETQHIDNVELILIDHPINTFAVHDLFNNIHIIDIPEPPIIVTDEQKKDVTKYFASLDKLNWQSTVYSNEHLFKEETRHNLVLKFKKPINQKKAGFVFSASSSIWGSYMVKDVLKLRGNQLQDWYDKMSSGGPEIMQLHNFNEREEHYFMKFYVKEGTEWVAKGYVPSSAPLNSDMRVAWFNLDNIKSDTVEIMIQPPKLFWSIDFAGIVGESKHKTNAKLLKADKVKFNSKEYSTASLSNIDFDYLSLVNPEDDAEIVFSETSKFNGRTKFLKITGYYDIHLKHSGQDESPLINKFLKEPGSIIKYSLDLYKNSKGVIE